MSNNGYNPQAVVPRTRRAIRERGLLPVIADYARWGVGLMTGLPWTVRGSRGHFEFGGERYAYIFRSYKWSWLTERAVEVPIAQALVAGYAGKRVLEVGNVLSHYGPQTHLVVDKYETADGVLNLDVLELEDLGQFDLIVAISTLEHVGWDEEPRDPDKAPEAVRSLEALLAPGGRMLLTVPVGYHPGLDAALRAGNFRLARSGALRRLGRGQRWHEVPADEVWGTPYDFLLYSARAIFVAVIDRPLAT